MALVTTVATAAPRIISSRYGHEAAQERVAEHGLMEESTGSSGVVARGGPRQAPPESPAMTAEVNVEKSAEPPAVRFALGATRIASDEHRQEHPGEDFCALHAAWTISGRMSWMTAAISTIATFSPSPFALQRP
ncbi:hypothetical protein [Nonomuraea dietziae]|uniref:hypothetical protein n=1 Tax=Nonomuraea dietziae TaxID=65515 RepID=UPI0031CF83D9